MLKQIYAVVRKDKEGKSVLTTITSIDGFRLIAERTRCYAPGKKSIYTYNAEGKLVSATAFVKKMTPDGVWHEVEEEAFFAEYKPKYGEFWDKMPHVMLAKVAEARALRRAFPNDLSGIYVSEEMDQAKQEHEAMSDPLRDLETVNLEEFDVNAEVRKFVEEMSLNYDKALVEELLDRRLTKLNGAPDAVQKTKYDLVIEYRSNKKFDEHMKLFIATIKPEQRVA